MEKSNKKSLKSLHSQQFQGFFVVGAEGFEPSASWTRTMRDTKLRHAPFFHSFLIIGIFAPNVKGFYAG